MIRERTAGAAHDRNAFFQFSRGVGSRARATLRDRDARHTIREAFPLVYTEWQNGPVGTLSFNADDQWFCGNAELFETFRNGIEERQALEVGSGPFGHLAPCKAFRRRTIIEPLAQAYRDIELQEFGKTFFTPDIRLHTTPAEVKIADLAGLIDGLIVCRNCLDHCDDPLAGLENIATYAAKGCWFFLWTDIWHLAHIDAGHRNITRSKDAMRAHLAGLGFDILQEGRPIRDPSEYIEFGCIARRC